MERFRNLSLNPRASQTAGGAAVGLYLMLTDGSDAGTFRLVPRWEPPPPKPALIDFMEFPNTVVSMPTGPLPPPVGQVVLLMVREGEQISSILLVPTISEQGSEEFKSREGNSYFNVRIDPTDALATVRFYDMDEGVHWRSTGVYYIDLVPKDEITLQTTQHVFSSVDQLFRETVQFHGKDSLDISFPPLRMNFKQDFRHDAKPIGAGTEGNVYRCLSRFNPHHCAVKETRPQDFLKAYSGSEPSEVKIFSMLNHTNVAEFFLAWSEQKKGKIFGTGSIFISMKLYARSLSQYLRDEQFELEDRKYIFRQIVRGIDYMHQYHVAHRDIKPGNIVIGEDLAVKILDFGIAKVNQPPDYPGFVSGCYGSKPYRAPEIVNSYERHTEMVDIFSAGILFYELFVPDANGRRGKVNQLSTAIRERTQEFDHMKLEFDLDAVLNGTNGLEDWKGYLSLLKRLTKPKANERPSALEILEFLQLYGSGSDVEKFGFLLN